MRTLSAAATSGRLTFGPLDIPCALGRTGIRALKREGDGATPRGVFPLRVLYFRPDRLRRPATGLPVRRLEPSDGWCDASSDRNYNRPVRLPYPASAEHMWREDGLYDLVIEMGHNRLPRVKGLGSAVFFHLARPGYRPTAGCIAVSRRDALRLLPHLKPGTKLRIGS